MKQYETDVLIIGTGGAGLYAAIRAADENRRVLIFDKGLIGRGGSTVGGAGVSAVGPWSKPGDNLDVHFQDTVVGGAYLNDQPLVRTLVEDAQDRIIEMEQWGLQFDREVDGIYVLDQAGGHSYPRLMAISDRVGLQMVKVLRNQVRKRKIERLPDVMAYQLLKRKDAVTGAVGIDLGLGEIIQVNAKAVILATGGIGQLYPATSNPIQSTGDGLALALKAGAKLINMEQVQFYPCGLVHPPSLRGFILGIQEYAKLYNANNERFMARYEPELLEHTTRDRLARSIYTEIEQGRGTKYGGVYLDATDVPEDIFRSFEHEYEVVRDRGFDMQKVRVEVAPAAHYFMGGIAIDRDGLTSIPGLYAAGEVSGGVQGGNRLSGNSLAGILVFGARAGTHAARNISKMDDLTPTKDEQTLKAERYISGLLNRRAGAFTSTDGKQQLRKIMWQHVGVIRDGESLATALIQVEALKSELLPQVTIQGTSLLQNQDLVSYLELENMITVAQAVIQSALARQESRGAHFRKDFPGETITPFCTEAHINPDGLQILKRPPAMNELQPEVGKGIES